MSKERLFPDIYERNKEVLTHVQRAIINMLDPELESPITRHLMDAEAYLQREIFGYELRFGKEDE